MQRFNTYDFKNVGGQDDPVLKITKKNFYVETYQGITNYKENYTKLYRLEYDRIDNTGVLVPFR